MSHLNRRFVFLIITFLVFPAVMVWSFQSFVVPIKYVLNNIKIPLQITAMVCWKFEDRLKFSQEFFLNREIGNRDYQFSIVDVKLDKFPDVQEQHRHLIIVDLGCNKTLTLLQGVVGSRLTHSYKWIVLNNNSNDENIIEAIFRNLPVLPNSNVFCITRSIAGDFAVQQIYRISMADEIIMEPFGMYINGSFVEFKRSLISFDYRRNLRRMELQATLVVINNDTLNHLDDYRDKHIDTLSKVNYILTNFLVESLNATIKYSFTNSWGYKDNRTGQWNGLIGDLVNKKSDIGATALFFTEDRVKHIQYISMPTPTRSKFVFQSPKLSYTENIFLLPFDKFVWYSGAGFLLIVVILLFWSTRIEKRISSNKDDVATGQLSSCEVFLVVIGATCQQGSTVIPKGFASRFIMIIAFIVLMFLYNSYSANIVALLQSPSHKIRTVEDLLNSRLQMGVDDTVFNHYYFAHATEETRRKIYEEKIRNENGSENFLSLEKGVAKIREGLFAFHMETGVGYKIVSETFFEEEKCALQEIQYLQVIDPWYAIQKNSSYIELLKIGMMRIHEYGLRNRENQKFYTKKPHCSGGGSFISASFIDIQPALMLLLWGFMISITLLLIEIIYFKLVTYRSGKKCGSSHIINSLVNR